MKRFSVIITVFMLLLSMSSCKLSDIFSYPGSDDKLMRECADGFFEAVKSRDVKLIEPSFSGYARNVDGFSDSVEMLISYIKGSIVTWEKVSSPVSRSSNSGKGRITELFFWYTLTTDEEEYKVFFYDVPADELHTNSGIGIHALMIIRKGEEDKLTGSMEDWASHEGISIPFYEPGTHGSL